MMDHMASLRQYIHHRNDEVFECAEHRDGPDTCDCGATAAFRAATSAMMALTAENRALRGGAIDMDRNWVCLEHGHGDHPCCGDALPPEVTP